MINESAASANPEIRAEVAAANAVRSVEIARLARRLRGSTMALGHEIGQ